MGKYFHKKLRDKNGKIVIHRVIGMAFIGILIAVLFALAFSFLVQYLWNNILASIFSIKTINFWQAFGIIILSKILFGSGFRKHGSDFYDHHHDHHKEKHHYHYDSFKEIHDNWEKYNEYWEKEGKENWEKYCKNLDSKE